MRFEISVILNLKSTMKSASSSLNSEKSIDSVELGVPELYPAGSQWVSPIEAAVKTVPVTVTAA